MLRLLLHEIIAKGYSEGTLKYGDLGLDLSTYENRLLLIIERHLGTSPPFNEAMKFAAKLNGRDLYLTTACARCSPGHNTDNAELKSYEALAWRAMEVSYKTFVYDLVSRLSHGNLAIKDVADSIFAELYLPDSSGLSRIASYDGRSSLSTWLRVVICNWVIDVQRSIVYSRSADLEPDLPDEYAVQRIESVLRTHRYQKALHQSFDSAFRLLTAQERLMILWRYQDGLQLGQIARFLGIHQSNVTRQLTRLLAKLRDEVVKNLTIAHGFSHQAIQECIEEIVGNPWQEVAILDVIRNTNTDDAAMRQ